MLVLLEYEDAKMNTLMNPREPAIITGEKDIDRIMKAKRVLSNKRLQICVAEAGLISYFKPIYNDKLKSGFPSTRQKFLKQAYEIEIESLVVEANTEDLGIRVFGRDLRSGYHHLAMYNMYDEKKRRSFFSLKMSDDVLLDTMSSGPVF